MSQKLATRSFVKSVPESKIESNSAGAVNYCSFERLRPFLAMAAGAKESEVIGMNIISTGVEIVISRKYASA